MMETTIWTSKSSKSEWRLKTCCSLHMGSCLQLPTQSCFNRSFRMMPKINCDNPWKCQRLVQMKTGSQTHGRGGEWARMDVDTSTNCWLADFLAICSYQNKLCGLCGDYDGQPNDDFRKPDGSLTSNANDFGHSWNTDPEWVLHGYMHPLTVLQVLFCLLVLDLVLVLVPRSKVSSRFHMWTLDNVRRITSGHCSELPFHRCSTPLELVGVRRVLTYWKYSVWFPVVDTMCNCWVQ